MANEVCPVFTGQGIQTDTTVVFVTIEDIRKANIKLIERIKYKELNELYESKINELNNLVIIQNDRINNLQNMISDINSDNEEKEKQLRKLKYITIGSVSVSATIIIGILIF